MGKSPCHSPECVTAPLVHRNRGIVPFPCPRLFHNANTVSTPKPPQLKHHLTQRHHAFCACILWCQAECVADLAEGQVRVQVLCSLNTKPVKCRPVRAFPVYASAWLGCNPFNLRPATLQAGLASLRNAPNTASWALVVAGVTAGVLPPVLGTLSLYCASSFLRASSSVNAFS